MLQPDQFVSRANGNGRWSRMQAIARHIDPGKIGLFLTSVFLFVLAISLMKEGAGDLAPLIRDRFAVTTVPNSLGFGWLFAYVIMSGSPVAAVALTFFEAGTLDSASTFAMITGSRFGGSFIVLFIGFIYMLRGRDRVSGLSMGLLSLTVTGSTYLVAFFIGLALLQTGLFDQFQIGSGAVLTSILHFLFGPLIAGLLNLLPRWAIFLLGLALIMLSFHLFDRCLPQMTLKESQIGHLSRLVYRPWLMFMLGAGITLLSMSVSISLSILVPLSHRGFIRRENVIPYILGANITTFIDTLFAAVLIADPLAFTIVLVSMVSISLVSVLVLSLIYRPFERATLAFVAWITAENQHLLLFMLLVLLLPLGLLLW